MWSWAGNASGASRDAGGLLISAFTLAGGSAIGQEKAKAPQVVQKKHLENDKVTVFEFRYAPGAENPSVPRNARVVRALTSGTLMRTYPDGKTENVDWKAGRRNTFRQSWALSPNTRPGTLARPSWCSISSC